MSHVFDTQTTPWELAGRRDDTRIIVRETTKGWGHTLEITFDEEVQKVSRNWKKGALFL